MMFYSVTPLSLRSGLGTKTTWLGEDHGSDTRAAVTCGEKHLLARKSTSEPRLEAGGERWSPAAKATFLPSC